MDDGESETVLLSQRLDGSAASQLSPLLPLQPTTDSIRPMQQMISSCTGALITSLVSTPLDVVRIRLQSQSLETVETGGAQGPPTSRNASPSWSSSQQLSSAATPHQHQQHPTHSQTHLASHSTTATHHVLEQHHHHHHQHQHGMGQFSVPPSSSSSSSSSPATHSSRQPTAIHRIILSHASSPVGSPRHVVLLCNGLMDHVCDLCLPSQKSQPLRFNGTVDALVKITQSEGLSSLWRGLPPTLLMAVPATVLYFTAYDQLRHELSRYSSTRPGAWMSGWEPVAAGAVSRTLSATIISPLELVRTKMQSTTNAFGYSELGKSVAQSIRSSGIKSLWLGLGPTLLRDVPFSAIYWLGYERIRDALQDRLSGLQSFNRASFSHSFLVSFSAGALSGMAAAAVTTPFDVVKTRSQMQIGRSLLESNVKMSTSWEIARQIYATNGAGGFFLGLSARIAKVAPACAIMISSYELGKKYFAHKNSLQS